MFIEKMKKCFDINILKKGVKIKYIYKHDKIYSVATIIDVCDTFIYFKEETDDSFIEYYIEIDEVLDGTVILEIIS